MIKIEMSDAGVDPTILCNICEQPIQHHSEGIAVYQQEGSLLRFHHRNCAVGGFTEAWPSIPIQEALLHTLRRLGIERDETQAAPEGAPTS